MYRVVYYASSVESYVKSKDFDTFSEAMQFSMSMQHRSRESVLEIKHYENSPNNGPTLWR